MIPNWLSLAVSVAAVAISAWTFWATMLKRGSVRMTRPTTIFFGPDASPRDRSAKVYLRFLMYSTSRRGRVVESMFVRLRSKESVQSFPVWVYGNKDLSRGSGLFVGPEGVAANHHFLLPKGTSGYRFRSGVNAIEVVARLVGDKGDISLGTYSLNLSEAQAEELRGEDVGVYFDWGGDHKEYVGWTDIKAEASSLPQLTPSVLALLAKELEGKKP